MRNRFTSPFAIADIQGSDTTPNLRGIALFYPANQTGIYIQVEVFHLPDEKLPNSSGFFGMHIHESGNCTNPFDQTGMHYNPDNMQHPDHLGDLPPLLSHSGYAWCEFYDGRLSFADIIQKSIVIHNQKDDFTTQPAGNSGTKIGCGVIRRISS